MYRTRGNQSEPDQGNILPTSGRTLLFQQDTAPSTARGSYNRWHALSEVSARITIQFLLNGAFAGNYNTSNSIWNNWGSNGNWWSSTSNQNYNANTNGMNGPNTNTNNWFSVRCVKKWKSIAPGSFFLINLFKS